MRWKRIVIIALMLSIPIFGQGLVQAQAPPADDEFLRLVSQTQGIPLERLQIGDRVDLTFPVTGALLYVAKVLDTGTGQVYTVALDVQHQPAELGGVEAAEENAKKAKFGKLDPHLHKKKAKLKPKETIPVAIWLHVPDILPNRAENFAGHLDKVKRDVDARKKPTLDFLGGKKIKAKTPKYAPVVFTELKGNEIDEVATALADVGTLYAAENYTAFGDDSGTTQRVHVVWAEGNYGAGPSSRPVVLDPGGVSDENPFLSNLTHSVIYWCAAVSPACPNGKNIQDHASELAGVATSTHPLFRGIAPSAQLILSANSQEFDDARLVEAFEWARGNEGNPTIVSWGTDCGGSQTFMSRYMDWAVRNLFATVVAAAGNHPTFCADPTDDEKVAAPGLAWSIITVGSHSDSNDGFWVGDSMSAFSDWRNPDFAPGMEKPEVVAVGEDIRTTDAVLDGDWLTAGGVSGTSYAAAQVAGQVTLMLSRQPGQKVWPETNKAAVLASAFHDIDGGALNRAKDGVGAVVMNHSDDTYAQNRFINDASPTGTPLLAADFPRNHLDALSLQAGQRVRVAMAWDSNSNGSTSDVLGADIDLCVRHPDNVTIVACSVSFQDAWEMVEFTAPGSGAYDILVNLASSDANWPGTFLGIAWSIQSLPTVCTGAIDVPRSGGTFNIDTANGPTFFDSYAGWGRDQSGREQLLKLRLGRKKDITFTDTNPDLDLHVVQFSSCSGFSVTPSVKGSGMDSVFIDNAPAGTYYLIVDGADGAVGTTTVTVSVTGP